MKKRTATVARKTKETRIVAEINLDGTGRSRISTGVPFLNHMLELLAKHSQMDLKLRATGDLKVDYHHTVEDIGIVLGSALDKALKERRGITRFGFSLVPMDESLARVAVDLGGRPFLVYQVPIRTRKIRDFDLNLIEEFFRGFVVQARINLHVALLYGKEPHHCFECVFKAVARALRMAVAPDPRTAGVPSTKGRI